MAENKTKLKLDRRRKNRRKLLIHLPPLPNGGTIEVYQGESRKHDDWAFAPLGTMVSRPKPDK